MIALQVWPIEWLFARQKFVLTVQERISRLNPDGIEEGQILRGYYRKPLSWRRAKRMMQAGHQPLHFRLRGGRQDYNAILRGPHPLYLAAKGRLR